MNAAAPNLGITPAPSMDATPRSGSMARQDQSGTVSFADSLHSARSSDAHSAPVSKANSVKTSSAAATNSSAQVKSGTEATGSTTSTDTNPSADQSETSVPPVDAQASEQNANAVQVNGNTAAQQASMKAQLQAEKAATDAAGDAKDQQTEVSAKPGTAGAAHSAEGKSTKKHASSSSDSATGSAATLEQTVAAQTAAQAVPFVAQVPVATTNQNAPSTKASSAPIAVAAKAAKTNATSVATPQTDAAAIDPNAPAQGNASAVQETAEDKDAVEGSASFADKIVAATGMQHAASLHDAADSVQSGATFSYSLHNAAALHSDSVSAKAVADTKSTASMDDVNAAASYTPVVRHLEVTVNDPVLGNVDVRAEMRGGALHASISGTQANVTAAAELHQFLQQHQVAVHTVSFHNAADSVRATGQSSGSSFTNTDSGSRENAQYNGSNAQQQNREGASERKSFYDGYTNGSVYGSTSTRPASSRIPAAMLTPQTSGGNLSIHI